jgi:predicted transcriptional regulator
VSRSFNTLGDLQKAVMEVLWSAGDAGVQAVRDRLDRGNDLAYTTILSVLQKLEKLGWVKRRREGRSHVYRAARTRDQEGVRSIRKIVEDVFGGDRLRLFQHLIDDEKLTPAEVNALRDMIARKRKEKRDD